MPIYASNLNENIDQDSQTGVQKRVAIYARVSTTEQAEEGYSIDEQTRLLRQYCEREGYVVSNEYVDRGISGKSIKGRASLQQLLDDARKRKFDIVLVWKSNRLARNILDMLKIVDFLKKQNIAFRSYSEKYETETPTGKLQFHMMAVIAEFERDNIAENVKMGMIARAKEGSWNGGRVLGYDSKKVESDGKRKMTKLVINEKEAPTVRRIFQLYTEGHGYKSIANTLNKEGHRTKLNNFFSINAVKTILMNPVYIGLIRYNVRRDWSEKRRNNINPNPVIERGHHAPIIDEEVWRKAQDIMKSRSRKPNRIHSGEFPLTGIMKCPVCGAGMVLGRTTNRNKDGTKRVLEYYVCGAWKNKGTAVCRSNGVRTQYADDYVLNKIAEFANNDVLIKDVVGKINEGHRTVSEPLQREYVMLKNSLKAIQSKKDKVLGLYEDGILNKADLMSRLAKLDEEKELLDERIAPIGQKLGQGGRKEISFKMVKQVMQSFSDSYKKSLTSEQRKQLLHLIINKITIADNRKIESIQIQLNNEVVRYFTKKEEDKSSDDDDLSSSFSIYFDL
ncbi:putative immunity region protein [Bacillus velezensis]|jgi:site-specific DNA recombinase|uniref:recombinase family protein n=1 Tax=Bacillus subtilis group TaxID=653685 RepID=UPI0007F88B85|nr:MULTISPECIES: recombinase family protein [Bacillus subtilis group]MEC0446178.1 recombinase family protein [Bacillus velezensis]OBR31537.1 putative immunity region protein [Bacillus velezensis]OCB92346.1 putative immunity region protein [Bacillus velezensis]RHJ09035.1 recombinase family protein [Bacillus sonorensis]WPP36686.1 recombinase family protein [Bacillus sonorensis]